MMNKTLPLLMILLSTGSLHAYEPLNRVVATVNDDVILESQLNNREEIVLGQLKDKQTQMPPREALREQILDRLILENLQLQIAERSGIKVDDDMLNNALRGMARENGMTLSDFRDKLESEGFNYVVFREQLRDEITITRIRQQMVENRIQVSEQEIDNLLANAATQDSSGEAYRLAHILVSVPEAASPKEIEQAQTRADAIMNRLKAGEDFAALAVAESDGQQALEGGDLGWREASKLPSLFSDVVSKLNKGQISEIIRSPSGFHIIKVIDQRGGESHQITQTHARHILLKADAFTSANDIQTRLEQIRERIVQGDDFAALARAYSEDPGSASQGGDLGWVNPGTMVPEFEKTMQQLKPGEISQPVESRFGWHLIQVNERRTRDNSDEYQRAQAKEAIRRRKSDEEMETWIRRLRDESYIELHLNPTS